MEENQRIKNTKKRLSEALTEMLEKIPLRSVSIRELCERAGINRTTFYNHYGSQYDLFEEISRRYLDGIAVELAAADGNNRESVQERVAKVLHYLEDHLTLSRLLLNNNIDSGFVERLFALPKITDLLRSALKDRSDEDTRTATISFALYGSYRLLLDWINNDDRMSCEQEAVLILGLARRVCQ